MLRTIADQALVYALLWAADETFRLMPLLTHKMMCKVKSQLAKMLF